MADTIQEFPASQEHVEAKDIASFVEVIQDLLRRRSVMSMSPCCDSGSPASKERVKAMSTRLIR